MAAPRNERDGYDGQAQIAHAIRRVGALYVAMSILPEGSSVTDLKATADDLAEWIGGSALRRAQEAREGPSPLGKAWPPTD